MGHDSVIYKKYLLRTNDEASSLLSQTYSLAWETDIRQIDA